MQMVYLKYIAEVFGCVAIKLFFNENVNLSKISFVHNY